MSALSDLKRLESLRLEFGTQAAQQKKACLQNLKSASLSSAEQVSRLHEVLCFVRAWPDNDAVLAEVKAMLDRFHHRRDLKKFAEKLLNSGIAGTVINFRFYAFTAKWLAHHWPDHLRIDWEDFENASTLERYLPLLASYSETPALDSVDMEIPDWVHRLKGRDETDASFVIRRLTALISNEFLHEQLYDELDIPLVLTPGQSVPNRTHAKYDRAPIVCQSQPLVRTRPDVAEEIRKPVTPCGLVNRATGNQLVNLARGAMVTRQRDLDAFAYADPHDVSLWEDDGLQFVLYGVAPQRRFLLETLYGFLVLKCGVPISYGAITCLFQSAEIAYTIFDTFRGGESARIFVRTLAMVHQIFGCDTFMIDPYQLGADNEDALQSGSWWFYQKLGFRPRDKPTLKLMNREMATMKRRPRHRSPLAVLERLAQENVYLSLSKDRDDVVGEIELANVGLKITDLLADRFGSNREEGESVLAAEAAGRLGVTSNRGWAAGEKLAWRRWSPLVALLQDVERWPGTDKEALVQLVRAKGGRQEIEYLKGFDRLRRLRKAVLKMAAG